MRLLRLSIVCMAGFVAACASNPPKNPPRWSANAEKPRDENYHGGPNAMLLQYDSNHDGTLTKAELIAGLQADFARLDTRHTGCLDPDQVREINRQRIDADQSTATPLQDWNQDGCVDYREFAAAAYSLFDSVDRNGDGKITPEEFDPAKKPAAKPGAPPPNPGQGQGRGRRGGGGNGGPPPGGESLTVPNFPNPR